MGYIVVCNMKLTYHLDININGISNGIRISRIVMQQSGLSQDGTPQWPANWGKCPIFRHCQTNPHIYNIGCISHQY